MGTALSFTPKVDGAGPDKGLGLMVEVARHCMQPRFRYTHVPALGELVSAVLSQSFCATRSYLAAAADDMG